MVNNTARYSLMVCLTTALTAPLLYLSIAGSYAASEQGFALIWLLATMGLGCAGALPVCAVFYYSITLLANLALTLNQTKFLLSILSTLLCIVALSLVYGWDNFETIYYKLFVTYVAVSIICIWLYKLKRM